MFINKQPASASSGQAKYKKETNPPEKNNTLNNNDLYVTNLHFSMWDAILLHYYYNKALMFKKIHFLATIIVSTLLFFAYTRTIINEKRSIILTHQRKHTSILSRATPFNLTPAINNRTLISAACIDKY